MKWALALSTQLGEDSYSFYVAQGFKLWGVDISRVEEGFQALEKDPFVPPSDMYGIEGIPYNVRVKREMLVAGFLELDDMPAVLGSPAWPISKEFASPVVGGLGQSHGMYD